MIIVSQDKKVVVNFERTNWVQVSKIDNKKSVIEINYANGDWKMIAEYKTEERATEYYNSLKRKSVYAMGDSGFTFEEKFYYEMPKE